jgi:hypothetical protein
MLGQTFAPSKFAVRKFGPSWTGFTAEQTRQLEHLKKLVELVSDTPDVEQQRLLEEEDFEGLEEYLKRKWRRADPTSND